MSNVQLGYTQVIDPISFKSIPSGKIYIGEYGTLPNPANAVTWKQAYFVNSDGTRTAASQPIRTNAAGFAVDGSGNIKTVQVDGGYSILVQDQYGATKLSQACSLSNAGEVLEFDTIAGFTGALDGSVCYFKGRDTVGDGGGGILRFLAGSIAPADGGTVYTATGGRLVRDGWSVFGVNPRWFGTSDVDSTAYLLAAAQRASASNVHMQLDGGEYTVTTLSLGNTDVTIEGTGTIRKKAGTTGHLITSTGSLRVKGRVTLDQNAANCPNPSATSTSDCAISHSGPVLDLSGVIVPAAVSASIRTSPTELLRLRDCDVDGGWLNLLASCGNLAKVEILGGSYANSTKDDNIQISAAKSFIIDGVESAGAFRSGIVVSGGASKGRISNCYSHDNKIDVATSQGGWGIVLSVSVADVALANNICTNNQRGPMTLDTFTAGPGDTATDARFTVTGGLLDADYNGSYGTTGLGINGARFVSVTGVRIRRATQHVLAVNSKVVELNGNTYEDCGIGYFVQANTCDDVQINGGIMRGCSNASQAIVQSFSNNRFRCTGVDMSGITGAGRHVFRIDNTADWTVDNNVAQKDDAGSGHILFLANAVTRGRVFGNKFKSTAGAFQYFYYAVGAALTDVVSDGNEVAMTGITFNPARYIFQNASAWAATTAYALNAYAYANGKVYQATVAGTSGSTAPSHTSGTATDGTVTWTYIGEMITYGGGEVLGGVKDYFPSAPTYCKFRQGQTAGIAGVLKMWNGTAWV